MRCEPEVEIRMGSDSIDLAYLDYPLPFGDLIFDVSGKIGRAIAFRYNAEVQKSRRDGRHSDDR
jgi:hypothetical protein